MTVASASAVPDRLGVLSPVRLSVSDAPVSEAGSRSIVGAAGAAVSMVTVRMSEASLSLPSASVAVAVKSCGPSPRLAVV